MLVAIGFEPFLQIVVRLRSNLVRPPLGQAPEQLDRTLVVSVATHIGQIVYTVWFCNLMQAKPGPPPLAQQLDTMPM